MSPWVSGRIWLQSYQADGLAVHHPHTSSENCHPGHRTCQCDFSLWGFIKDNVYYLHFQRRFWKCECASRMPLRMSQKTRLRGIDRNVSTAFKSVTSHVVHTLNAFPSSPGNSLTKHNMICCPHPPDSPELAPVTFLFSQPNEWSRQNNRQCWTWSQHMTSRMQNCRNAGNGAYKRKGPTSRDSGQ